VLGEKPEKPAAKAVREFLGDETGTSFVGDVLGRDLAEMPDTSFSRVCATAVSSGSWILICVPVSLTTGAIPTSGTMLITLRVPTVVPWASTVIWVPLPFGSMARICPCARAAGSAAARMQKT
jgi:hypothetical protein